MQFLLKFHNSGLHPEVWFAQTEAQFSTKHITAESTKYNHVIAALDKSVAEEISAFICSPPVTNKYSAVKEILISVYGLTHTDKDARLLALSGLDDRKPIALLRYMDSLTAPEDRKTTIYRALFLSHLPEAIRVILACNPPADLVDLAKAADDILAVHLDKTLCSTSTVDAVKYNPREHENKHTNHTTKRCFYHVRFGIIARKCGNTASTPCDMADLITSPTPTKNVKTIAPIQVDNIKKTLTICDHKSGKYYLVDSGAEVSCISASFRDKRLLSPSTPLVAANGSKIGTWGKRNQVIHL